PDPPAQDPERDREAQQRGREGRNPHDEVEALGLGRAANHFPVLGHEGAHDLLLALPRLDPVLDGGLHRLSGVARAAAQHLAAAARADDLARDLVNGIAGLRRGRGCEDREREENQGGGRATSHGAALSSRRSLILSLAAMIVPNTMTSPPTQTKLTSGLI